MCRDCERRKKTKGKNKTIVCYENNEFVVPRGVDKVSVTLLGAGGAGGAALDELAAGGGGSGYLVSDYILDVKHCDTLGIVVGKGGNPVDGQDGQDGQSSSIKYNDITVTAFGGKGGRIGTFQSPDPLAAGNGGDGYYGGGGGLSDIPDGSEGKGGKGIAPSFNGNNAGGLPDSGDGSSGGKGIEGRGGGGPAGGNGGGSDGTNTTSAQNGTDGLGSGGGGAGFLRTNPPGLNNGGKGGSGYVKIQYTKTKYC